MKKNVSASPTEGLNWTRCALFLFTVAFNESYDYLTIAHRSLIYQPMIDSHLFDFEPEKNATHRI